MFRSLLSVLFLLLTISAPCLASSAAVPKEPKPQEIARPVLLPHEHNESCDLTAAEPIQIICILDRSGSMQRLAGDVIGGYNSFLEEQRKEPGAAEVTTVLFDNQYEIIGKGVNLQEAPDMTASTYYARGTTALLDAVGRTVMETVGQMEKDGVCPMKRRVIFMIMTDGLENASHEYDKATVKSLIEKTTDEYHWNYLFMGANIDSVAEAASIGIRADCAVNYSHDSEGVKESFSRMNEAAKKTRDGGL